MYQLDFGGRVTQESAKNFQIEFKNRQVSVHFVSRTDMNRIAVQTEAGIVLSVYLFIHLLMFFGLLFFVAQVMQFGRIDSNAYTLDFQYPFTAIQAFAVALANVTQRLK